MIKGSLQFHDNPNELICNDINCPIEVKNFMESIKSETKSDIIMALDHNGNIIEYYKNNIILGNYDERELLGKNILDLLYDDASLDIISDQMKIMNGNGGSKKHLIYLKDKFGDKIPALIYINIYLIDGKNLILAFVNKLSYKDDAKIYQPYNGLVDNLNDLSNLILNQYSI